MTLKDIAEMAGVSMMTVSNVINGKNNRVSEKTREKIMSIIQEYGYAPNMSARNLTTKTSNIIGIVIATDENNLNFADDPYASSMLGVIELELQKNGYYSMIHSVKTEDDFKALLKNWNVDGIISLFPLPYHTFNTFIQESTCPIAIFDNPISYPNIINVCSDDEKGLYLSTKYMINRGHTNIAFVADYEGNPLLTARFNGYKRALSESRITLNPDYVFKYPASYEGGIQAGRQIASSGTSITAAVTTADICAIGIMEGARLSGLRIPIDLSVIGYDDLALCRYVTPKLTSISQNLNEKALKATQLLIEKIKDGTATSNEKIVMDVELIDRQSAISLF